MTKTIDLPRESHDSLETDRNLDTSNEVLSKQKKPKSSSIIKEGQSVSSHITFGRHGVRFIPRQVFAMPKKTYKPNKISTPNNSTEEMTDLRDLQDALQGSSSSQSSIISGFVTLQDQPDDHFLDGMES